MKTLTIEHLAPYLPYKLKIQVVTKGSFNNLPNDIHIEEWSTSDILKLFVKRYRQISCKPILRPLSDLTKEIEHIEWFVSQGFYEAIDFPKRENILSCPYVFIEKLFEWHFDVFNLIPDGLAVDINTIQK